MPHSTGSATREKWKTLNTFPPDSRTLSHFSILFQSDVVLRDNFLPQSEFCRNMT